MRTGFGRFGEEFFLYSSQFVAFFVFILFVTPDSGSLGIVSAAMVTAFILIQTMLLVSAGHKPVLRMLYSFIAPFGYSIVRAVTGGFTPTEMATVVLWGAALYSALFQTAALSSRRPGVRRAAESLLASGSAAIFVFFYYYLNVRLEVEREFEIGTIDRAAYLAALDIRAFPASFYDFIKRPQHWFPAFAAGTFAFMLLASKLRASSLRDRMERLAKTCAEGESPVPAGDEAYARPRKQAVTVVSSDILGFTEISERLGPEKAAWVLDRYYSIWNAEARSRSGRIVSYTGDSVILVFGLAGDREGAENALASALGFFDSLPGLRDDLAAAGLPASLDVSVGIHTGTIVAAIMGLEPHRRFGVFGDAVAVAARLDSLCRELKQDLLVGQTTFSRLGLDSQARLESIGEVLLRRSTHPVPVYGMKQKYH